MYFSHISKQLCEDDAKRTIDCYLYWMKAYIIFIGKTHSNHCDEKAVEQFLSYL
ncbi:phage integrase N-terminal SAM-like domain-containing protein [Colwellia sp. MB02u-9]|uniref:phage integrase N-terminal SAM-like domain-containing protein n=1 Tax=Colwellia sp. MB02u-9 TaxID=2759823 RepID=UPI003855B0CE